MGVLGFFTFLLLMFSFKRGNNKTILVLLLYFIGSFHYPSMFQPAGQVLTAMILILSKNSPELYKNLQKKNLQNI